MKLIPSLKLTFRVKLLHRVKLLQAFFFFLIFKKGNYVTLKSAFVGVTYMYNVTLFPYILIGIANKRKMLLKLQS